MRRAAALAASIVLSISSLTLVPAHAWNQSTFGALALGSNGTETIVSIAIDTSGNIYVTGTLDGSFDVDPSPSSTVTLTRIAGVDIWIAKFNSSGEFIWGKVVGGTDGDLPYGIDVDSAGSAYVVGTFASTVDFDPSAGTANLTSQGNNDNFILKLTTDGNFAWVKQVGGINEERATGVTVDSADNVLVTGFFSGTVDFNPAPLETTTIVGNYYADIFILKLNSNGLYQWAKSVGTTDFDIGYAITTDASDNIYTTGIFRGSVDFDPGAGTTSLTAEATYGGAFILKLSSSGVFGFAKSFDGTNQDQGMGIDVDGTGNVVVVGNYQLTVDFDPGAGTANLTSPLSKSIFVVKLDNSGNYIWAKSIGNSGYEIPYDLKINSNNEIYLGGNFMSTVDFDPNAGTNNITAQNGQDSFVLKLNSSGNFIWVAPLYGDQSQQLRAMEITSGGYLLISGVFYGSIDFDPSPSTTLLAYAVGMADIFLARLASDGTLSPATLIDKAIFTSVGISGGGIVATYRTATTLSASVNVAAKVSFLSNGKFVAGCRNLLATGSGTSFTATCSWKPSARGSALISAVAVPTGAGISSGVSTPVNLVVANRTTKR